MHVARCTPVRQTACCVLHSFLLRRVAYITCMHFHGKAILDEILRNGKICAVEKVYVCLKECLRYATVSTRNVRNLLLCNLRCNSCFTLFTPHRTPTRFLVNYHLRWACTRMSTCLAATEAPWKVERDSEEKGHLEQCILADRLITMWALIVRESKSIETTLCCCALQTCRPPHQYHSRYGRANGGC